MVKIPASVSLTQSAKGMCIGKFVEWWSVDRMRRIMSDLDPGSAAILRTSNHIDHDTMAGFLYDLVGSRFLRDIDNDLTKRRMFLGHILNAVIQKRLVREADIIDMAAGIVRRHIDTIDDVIYRQNMTENLCRGLAHELGLPPSVTVKDTVVPPPQTEVVEPHTPLNPLYDYQYSTGMLVRDMLEGKRKDQDGRDILRRLIAVPTGSGKTRMMVQTLVQWLNDGKPSREPQRRNSKFILWVAQSSELCEQAFGTFRSVFESEGKRGTTLRLYRFWGPKSTLPKMGMKDMLDERSVIVATIQSLYKLQQSAQLNTLGKLTSCIVIDEAHHSITTSYSSVLRKMGFNWDNRKAEISTWGIVLIGLTATPFRGSGDNNETERLKRRYGDVHFPAIPYIQNSTNYKPHALIDCQTSARAGEAVHILGERSYDRDGFIRETDYFWNIRRLGPDTDIGAAKTDWSRRDEWTLQGDKNVTFRFQELGTYEITLRVVDNEGDSGNASTQIKIIESGQSEEEDESEQQKRLYRRLIKRKILCEVFHRVLKTNKTVNLDEKDKEHLDTFGDFRKETLKTISESFERNEIILHEIVRLRENGKKKILFFGCSVEHSRRIALYLQMRGIRARYVDSKMGANSRAEAIEAFRNSDLEVLCNFGVLSTGFDAPNIDCVFVGRPVKSTLLYTQMIGRGMRGIKSGGTVDVLVVDIDDNFQLQDQSTVQLGWKIFAPYWGETEEVVPTDVLSSEISKQKVMPKDASDELDEPCNEEQFETQEIIMPDATSLYEHVCIVCGIKASGVEGIADAFGIASPPEILAEYLADELYDQLPTKCYQCRMAQADSAKRGVDDTAGPADNAEHQKMHDAGRPGHSIDDSLTPDTEQMLWERFDEIMSHDRKSDTYNFAFAAYLLCHAGREDAGLVIRYVDIADAFLRYYWPQVVKCGIRQNVRSLHPPQVVKIIHKRFRRYRSELADAPAQIVDDAISDILWWVFGNSKKAPSIVSRFQTVRVVNRFVEDRAFYEYSDSKKILNLRPQALAFFRKNRVRLLGRVFEGWARFLVRVNTPKRLTALVQNYRGWRDVAADDVRTARDLGSESCFACGTDIEDTQARLYHVMPWSYVFESQMWSSVPMCNVCRGMAWDNKAGQEMIGRLIRVSQVQSADDIKP